MKTFFKLFVTIFIIVVQQVAYAQCWFSELISDFDKNTTEFKEFMNSDQYAMYSYEQLYKANRKGLKQDVSSLKTYSKCIQNPKLKQFGITDEILAKLQGSQSGISYADVLKQVDDFMNNFDPKNIQKFSEVISDLQKGGGWTDGAEWTLRYLNNNASHFKNRKLAFEQYQKWNDAENTMIRIADITDNTDPKRIIYFEFKSVDKVPPTQFKEQFIKDLAREDVENLSQIKWIFNGRKIDKLPQKDFIKALESSKEKLFNSKAKQLFEKEFGETFLDADDLIQALYKNEDWFKKVFQRVNLK